MELKLKVSPEKVKELFDSVRDDLFQKSRHDYWHVESDGTMKPQSVFWFFCWAYNGDNYSKAESRCKTIWDKIMPFTYSEFNEKIGYGPSKRFRYSKHSIDPQAILKIFQSL